MDSDFGFTVISSGIMSSFGLRLTANNIPADLRSQTADAVGNRGCLTAEMIKVNRNDTGMTVGRLNRLIPIQVPFIRDDDLASKLIKNRGKSFCFFLAMSHLFCFLFMWT